MKKKKDDEEQGNKNTQTSLNLQYTFLLDASETRLFRDTAYSAENSVLSVHVMNWREHVMKTLVRQ